MGNPVAVDWGLPKGERPETSFPSRQSSYPRQCGLCDNTGSTLTVEAVSESGLRAIWIELAMFSGTRELELEVVCCQRLGPRGEKKEAMHVDDLAAARKGKEEKKIADKAYNTWGAGGWRSVGMYMYYRGTFPFSDQWVCRVAQPVSTEALIGRGPCLNTPSAPQRNPLGGPIFADQAWGNRRLELRPDISHPDVSRSGRRRFTTKGEAVTMSREEPLQLSAVAGAYLWTQKCSAIWPSSAYAM